jgi:Spy/CpxP family protein refolding chaperone
VHCRLPLLLAASFAALAAAPLLLRAQPPAAGGPAPQGGFGGFGQFEARALGEPFKGITANGTVIPGLYEIRATGVSTEPVVRTAGAFLAALTPEQRAKTQYPVDDDEWRKWANVHRYPRQGVSFDEMTPAQKSAAMALLAASLSAKGLQLSEDIMHLNETLAELNDNNFDEYGEGKYWLTVMGMPSSQEPWGWQLDGHHLIINYFVLGDQVVMTPAFWGSEPAVATSGKYAGTRIMEDEQRAGLAMVRALTPQQRERAVLEPKKTGNNIRAQLFSDNVVVDFAGVPVAAFTASQKEQLLELIELYVGNLRNEHARIHLADVAARLDDTYFAWVGETNDDSVFYYRIHSPVVLIEFDHQTPVGLTHLYPRGVPYREHIHAVVRTPNGNDYGKDLLRQHYERHPH